MYSQICILRLFIYRSCGLTQRIDGKVKDHFRVEPKVTGKKMGWKIKSGDLEMVATYYFFGSLPVLEEDSVRDT